MALPRSCSRILLLVVVAALCLFATGLQTARRTPSTESLHRIARHAAGEVMKTLHREEKQGGAEEERAPLATTNGEAREAGQGVPNVDADPADMGYETLRDARFQQEHAAWSSASSSASSASSSGKFEGYKSSVPGSGLVLFPVDSPNGKSWKSQQSWVPGSGYFVTPPK